MKITNCNLKQIEEERATREVREREREQHRQHKQICTVHCSKNISNKNS